MSNFGARTEAEYEVYRTGPGRDITSGMRMRGVITEEQVMRNLREQVALLVDAGVDFLLAEATGDDVQRGWVLEAVASAGVPYWAGFKCHVRQGEDVVRTSYFSEVLLADELDEKLPLEADVLSLFHSTIEDTDRALPLLQSKWSGALGCYPEAGRRDYVQAFADPNVENPHTLEEWVSAAQAWTERCVQVIGGCCGMGLDHIRVLRGKLPKKAAA